MKKIYVNGKFFGQRTTGTQRYARELLNQFDSLLSPENPWKLEIEILVPPDIQPPPVYNNLQVRRVGWMSGTNWEQVSLPVYCHGHLLLTLSGGAPVLHARNVMTIHDAAVVASPTGYSRPYRLWHRTLCRRMAQTAEHIFTVSNFSKSEIIKWYDAVPDKISVTYLGSDHFYSVTPDASALGRFGISDRYILAASVRNPNKNFDRLMQAVRRQNDCGISLVIAGGSDRSVYRTVRLPDGIRGLGYVSDSELKALYDNACCFVFPSLYEGFGLPPLEALSSGCPIVVSNRGSLREVFHEVAFLCDPYDAEDIAVAIQRATAVGRSRTRELKEFARRFSWETCARQTLDVMKELA